MRQWALVLVAVLVAGCGGSGLSIPLEYYLPAERGDLALSPSGRVAAVQWYRVLDPDEQAEPRVELWRRVGDVRRIAVSHGQLVDRPSDRDALILTGDLELAWIVGRQRVALAPALPRGAEWVYRGGAVNHRAGAALLAFAESPAHPLEESEAQHDRGLVRLALVDVDVRAMRVAGKREVSIAGAAMSPVHAGRQLRAAETIDGQRRFGLFDPRCVFAPAPGPSLYVTCRAPEPPGVDTERWFVTRHDRRSAAWTASLALRAPPPWQRPGAVLSSASGDGRALVIEHGGLQSGIVEVQTTAVVEAATGAVRRFRRDPQRALGRVEVMVPVPGRPAVAEMHAYYPGSREHEFVATSAAFLGISLVNTRTGAIENLLDTSEEAARHLRHANSSTLGVLPDGTFVLGHDPRRR